MASSTSLVVTWQRVSWVMDFARRWTAASLIGVGRSIPKAKLSTGFSVDVKPLGFFSSRLADVALRLGPYMRVSS